VSGIKLCGAKLNGDLMKQEEVGRWG